MLDNFDHIKAYFINIGPQLTQVSLTMGASDVHGTLVRERIRPLRLTASLRRDCLQGSNMVN